jgi:hypothetical protein
MSNNIPPSDEGRQEFKRDIVWDPIVNLAEDIVVNCRYNHNSLPKIKIKNIAIKLGNFILYPFEPYGKILSKAILPKNNNENHNRNSTD